MHGEEAKELRGYYDDKYWSGIKVSEGLSFVQHSEKEGNVQFAPWALGDNAENMTVEFAMMRSYVKQKFPERGLEKWICNSGKL